MSRGTLIFKLLVLLIGSEITAEEIKVDSGRILVIEVEGLASHEILTESSKYEVYYAQRQIRVKSRSTGKTAGIGILKGSVELYRTPIKSEDGEWMIIGCHHLRNKKFYIRYKIKGVSNCLLNKK